MSKILLKYNNKLLKRNGTLFNGYEGTPICDFNASGSSASQITITSGDRLNFYDTSLKSPTSWSWNFGSGTPSTSTVKNPTGITFSTTGLTNISLTVSNNFGTNSKTKTNYINVENIQTKKIAINLYANLSDAGYETGVTWTPSGLSQRVWTWNHFTGNTNGLVFSPLKYTDNTVSSYSATLLANFEAYNNGKSTGNNTGIYPDKVIVYNLVNTTWNPMVKQIVRISGLNSSTTYKFTMSGSRGSWSATSRFTITGGTSSDGSSVTLDINDNTQNTVSISNVTPTAGGIIEIGLDHTNSSGYMNAIEIDEGA